MSEALLAPRERSEATAQPPEDRRRLQGATLRRVALGLSGLVTVLIIWELAALWISDPVTLPTVQETVQETVDKLTVPYPAQGHTLVVNALISTGRILAGFLLGTLAGLILGGAMASVRVVRDLIDPILQVTRPLPPIAFIPLLVVWFGIGEASKVALIFSGVLPVVTIATLSAIDAVPAELLQASRSLGASPLHTLLHVRFRSAVPGVITGLRLAMGGAWTSIIAAEMIAATGGVGFLILQAGNYLQTSLIFSGIAFIAVLGFVFDALLRLLLRAVDPTSR
jgi:NitT/TauT family transport system permease protein/taurine transport system permease protein